MSAWGAPSPRSRPAGVEVSLDKADAVIEGLRFFLRFALSNPRANWQSLTRSGAWVAPHSHRNTRSRWTITREWKSAPLERAHYDEIESIGKNRAIPQRGTTHHRECSTVGGMTSLLARAQLSPPC
jgi:hypothetical protein